MKRKKLEAAGWRVGTADEFLGLTAEVSALVSMKLALADGIKARRKRLNLTQAEVAARIGSNQSRLAKMESADPSVSIDLLVKSLLALGATTRDVGRTLICTNYPTAHRHFPEQRHNCMTSQCAASDSVQAAQIRAPRTLLSFDTTKTHVVLSRPPSANGEFYSPTFASCASKPWSFVKKNRLRLGMRTNAARQNHDPASCPSAHLPVKLAPNARTRSKEDQPVTPAPLIRFTSRRRPALLALAASACIFASSPPLARQARAAEPYNNALDWVPAEAALFSTNLRLKEQVDVVAASNAWKTFRAIPAVASAWNLAENQVYAPGGPAAMFWQMMELPENKQLVQVLGEMVSDEMVIYAGKDVVKLIELYQTMNASRLAPLRAALESGSVDGPAEDPASQFRMIAEAIKEDPALVDVPEIVLAFRIKDRDAATTQLARLEILANMALEQTSLGAKFERRKLGDAEFLVLYLDGSMLPWQGEEPSLLGWDEQTWETFKDIVSKKTLYLSIGLWNDYVVVSLNKSTDNLANLGKGPAIGGRDELASLSEHRDQKLVNVYYASSDIVASQTIAADDLDALAAEVGSMVKDGAAVPDKLKQRIADDLDELADDCKRYLPAPGAAAGYQFLTDSGYEGFAYSWATMPTLDGSQPLELLKHLGGSPIIALAGRGIEDPEGYDVLVKWVKKGFAYFQDVGLPQLEVEERASALHVIEVAGPLVKRFDDVTRTKLVPALADGQSGIVLDADIASKQWCTQMPASFAPLPMAEFALVMGVADAELLTSAMSDYRQIINDAIDAVRREHPDDVPSSVQFPAPVASEASGGTVYAWTLNKDLGVDDQIVPCCAVSDSVAAFATSRALAERVLAEQPLAAATAAAVVDDAEEPRAVAIGLNWAELMSAVEPWVMYGVRTNFAGESGAAADPSADPADVQAICAQINTGFDVLRCFDGAWCDMRQDGDVWVTHSVTLFHDLKE